MNLSPQLLSPVRDWPAPAWPLNEIMLQSLIAAGKSDGEIARRYGVDAETVVQLRESYGL